MRYWLSLVVIGTIIVILGIIFHLQGQSVVGPESSFMYANPEWENYGFQIAIIGGIILGAGIVMRVLKK
ncbi:MAG: hypothetical protein GTN35_03390 [Nitrososphaeria archaeon]|nr:hypothetical protein [Nitrosopumilaceae archaeon]NIP09059.1 hypothetical protein [Nitrosopumilaceae archaeon]NIP91428.1 hypothetical protein [Nitrososphaeria archaeon]NIS95255.1 hypothetical protein [Nitrosopumilaceae archaeon]